jgi:hypothetical protein
MGSTEVNKKIAVIIAVTINFGWAVWPDLNKNEIKTINRRGINRDGMEMEPDLPKTES